MVDHEKQTLLITGGTGKIGAIFVEHFARKGSTVIVAARNPVLPAPEITCADDSAKQGKIQTVAVDLQQPDACGKVCNFLDEHDLRPTVLVNNARDVAALKLTDLGLAAREDWLAEYLLDVVVPYELAMALARQKASRLVGIVNISSMYGVVAPNPELYENPLEDSPIQYSVAKAALIHLTRELSVRLAAQGIRVNAISYGGIEGRVSEQFKARYARLCPMGRMLTDEDIAGALEFLVSDASRGMTGHNLVVDGGWSVW